MNTMQLTEQSEPTPVPTGQALYQSTKLSMRFQQRLATASALLECIYIMDSQKINFHDARRKLKENNPYWINSSDGFSYLRYAGEATMPYATIDHQITMLLLMREHILQEGLLDLGGKLYPDQLPITNSMMEAYESSRN